ncbi:MAG: uridine diphosphate-N-acetylglucosamine-binding protein YvcK [Syntrophomonadaceae bacterium]|nr:uridine diphosphate-N-acetylglucosamine-binding protein YvcK [Syntrophomonadaceae bacterium]
MKWVRWLYPGLRVKRWLAVALTGVVSLAAGVLVAGRTGFLNGGGPTASPVLAGLLLVLLGLVLMVVGIRSMVRSLIGTLLPNRDGELVEAFYQRRLLGRGYRVVVVGGGTGISVLLRGLKEYTSNLTALVTVTDDGGSSGRLRAEMGVLPPGDIRNCLVALADTETLMDEVLGYRFRHGYGLTGHNLGNLLLAGLTELTGSFVQAIQEVSKVLAIRGQVLPATLSQETLCAELLDGTVLEGETRITQGGSRGIRRVFLKPGDSQPVSEALRAIAEADAVVLGPGSLYTSVIPNLLVNGISEAICQSPGIKIYICNVMTQPGETERYAASDHLRAIYDHCGPGFIDYVIVNTQEMRRAQLRKYQEKGAQPVRVDYKALAAMGVKVVGANLLEKGELVRHDPKLLAGTVIEIIRRRGADR